MVILLLIHKLIYFIFAEKLITSIKNYATISLNDIID